MHALITVCGAPTSALLNERLLERHRKELMMPTSARRDGDSILVDSIDLKRASRNLLNKTREPNWAPPRDLNQAMELMASAFGYANLHAVNSEASRTSAADLSSAQQGQMAMRRVSLSAVEDVTFKPAPATASWPAPESNLSTEKLHERLAAARSDGRQSASGTEVFFMSGTAIGKGAALTAAPDTFPADCGDRFDQRWRNLASAGLYSAFANASQPGDVVAIVGKSGTGKTLLAQAMADAIGGVVLDFRKANWREAFDRVLRDPPRYVFIDEIYHHSDATKMEVARFALRAQSTKTVFLFQNQYFVTSLLSQRHPDGRQALHSAQVLDLDRMTLSSMHSSQEVSLEDTQAHLGASSPAATPVPAEKRSQVHLRFEYGDDSTFETELLPDDMRVISGENKPDSAIRRVTLSLMKLHPDGPHAADTKVFTAQDWDRFVETVDPAAFCLESTATGNLTIEQAIELAKRKPASTPAPRSMRPR